MNEDKPNVEMLGTDPNGAYGSTKKSVINRLVHFRFYSAIIIGVVLCGVFSIKYTLLKLRISFAYGQISTFEVMRSSLDNISEPGELSAKLEYVLNYYPSGSKQITGTQLDKIVELARSNTASEIISHLRVRTGKDVGSDPQRWLKEYPPKD